VSFGATPWTQVAAAGSPDPEERCRALERLLPRYQGPIKTYLTMKYRLAPDQADDLFQEFVRQKILIQNLLQHANRERGRFRTFLLKALNNFVQNELRKTSAQKRAPDGGWVSLDELPESAQPQAEPSLALQFEADWMRATFAEAVERMRRDCAGKGQGHLWDVFEACFLRGLSGELEPAGYDELVKRFGFESPAQVYNAKASARALFHRKLREVIGEYTRDEAEVEEILAEWRGLFRMVRLMGDGLE